MNHLSAVRITALKLKCCPIESDCTGLMLALVTGYGYDKVPDFCAIKSAEIRAPPLFDNHPYAMADEDEALSPHRTETCIASAHASQSQ